jgi:hypothetical protein
MASTPWKLRSAQAEVQRAALNQDLFEVPKRAELDRAAEARLFNLHAPEKPTPDVTADFDHAKLLGVLNRDS